jgi:hypothetical protein
MKCEYNNCDEKPFKDQKYCLLHMEFPERTSDEFEKIANLKDLRLNERINKSDLSFKGVKLYNVNFQGKEVNGDLIFAEASILGVANFNGAKINGDLWFDGISVNKYVSFEFAKIKGNASFYNAKIGEYLIFDDSKILRYAWFEKSLIGGEISFNRSEVGGSTSFKGSVIDGNASFYGSYIGGDAWFDGAKISGDTWFDFTTINGGLSFRGTRFKNLKGQERACRKAKIIWEKLGDREKADYHFYREMESKRKQKSLYIRFIELVVQYPFGYGVYPSRLLYCFALATIIFAILFFFLDGTSNSFGEKLRFSFLTMIIPAYGVINAKTGILGILTIIEALIGAFTWPTFIVTFARKYMR